ncbi:MAG: DinB family protein [Planctomycetaceae bacterium]
MPQKAVAALASSARLHSRYTNFVKGIRYEPAAGHGAASYQNPWAILTIGVQSELDRWKELDARRQDYLNQLTDAEFEDVVFKVSGQRAATKRSDILLHVCTHAQYTTAQLVNMLRQAGQTDLPDVMLISMARTETL